MNLKKRQQRDRFRQHGGWAPWLKAPKQPKTDCDLMREAIIAALASDKDVYCIWPMQPLHRVGPIAFTASSDGFVYVKCRIDERRYKVADNYKITLQPEDKTYSYEHYYWMDFVSHMRSGIGTLWIDGEEFILSWYSPARHSVQKESVDAQ